MLNKTNWLAIIVAAVAGMALGFLWYGNLFLDDWMLGNGITLGADEAEMIKNGEVIPMSSLPMIINTVALLIYALIMNWLIDKTGLTDLAGGAKLGAIIGFTGLMLIYVNNRFAHAPTSLSMIDGVYTLVLFTIIGAIVGGWRKK